MNRLNKAISLIALLLWAVVSRAQHDNTVFGEVLVQLNAGSSPEKIEAEIRFELGILPDFSVSRCVSEHMRIWLFSFNENAVSKNELLTVLRHSSLVQTAQANHIISERIVPNDPFFGQQWHHQEASDHDIDSDLAWDITTGGLTATGDEIVVCVVELGGSKWNTPDIVDNHWTNDLEIPLNGVDDDLNGFVDDYNGWNISANSDVISSGDHGTRVSSMIGAKGNNSTGVTGVNWDVKLMQVEIGGVSEASAIAGYEYPLKMRKLYNETNGAKGAFVVATNSSWGTDNGQPADAPLWCAMYDSLGFYGILSCGSTSNNNVNVDDVGDLPTACPSDYLISVGRTNSQDVRASGGYGLTTIDMMAPGDNVYLANNTSYGTTTGTSFSSPCVAGSIALIYSAPCNSFMQMVALNPAAAAAQMKNYILNGVDQTTPLLAETVSGGRLNVNNSLNLLLDNCDNSSCISPFGIETTQEIGSLTYIISWDTLPGIPAYSVQFRIVGSPDWTIISDIADDHYALNDLLACTEYEVQVMSQCESSNSSWSQSYVWTSDGCCVNPDMHTINYTTESTAEISWNTVLAAESYTITATPDNGGDAILFDNVTENPFVLSGLAPCTLYQIAILSVCPGISDPATAFNLHTAGCTNCSDLEYCTVTANSTSEHIALVSVGDINRTSGSDNGYILVSDMTTTFHAGSTQSISLTPGYAGGSYNENFKVWIDYNSDGDFDEPNETAFDAPTSTTTNINGTFLVPDVLTTGIVRMRVAMSYTFAADPQEPTSCGQWSFGEIEDYCVMLDAITHVDEEFDHAISIFPNPTKDILNVMLPKTASNERTWFDIYNSSGMLISSSNNQNGNSISVQHLSSGLYYLVVRNSNFSSHSKFMKE